MCFHIRSLHVFNDLYRAPAKGRKGWVNWDRGIIITFLYKLNKRGISWHSFHSLHVSKHAHLPLCMDYVTGTANDKIQ